MNDTTTVATTVDTSPQAIRAWLTDRVAYYLERSPADLDEGAQLAEMGLDSVFALTLCGDVEDRFGLVVEPTMAWDHPTIDAITAYLAAELAG
ncbi:acyl carrier protein [Streptomyces sp. P17]|uniref:acyl carrier protein n=1 Tax=Streptomyces sp. P17 TaxID=3074716 RepID=UPI0028F436FB|nr:acyl carrier protein [Streptomyces sp. P17]MDT9701429.1 acyl carrier protein [Streptomyces sp. P17]